MRGNRATSGVWPWQISLHWEGKQEKGASKLIVSLDHGISNSLCLYGLGHQFIDHYTMAKTEVTRSLQSHIKLFPH